MADSFQFLAELWTTIIYADLDLQAPAARFEAYIPPTMPCAGNDYDDPRYLDDRRAG